MKKYQHEIKMLAASDGYCTDLPVSLIVSNRNVRHALRLDDEFLESIRTHGIIQPILVTVSEDRPLCVAGHRRLAAAIKLGMTKIKCVSKKVLGAASITTAVSENVHRSPLDPLDLAESFQELALQGITRKAMEALFDRDRKTIGRYLKMAEWTARTKELIRAHPGRLNSRQLLALASRRKTPHEIEAIIVALLASEPQRRGPRRPSGQALVKAVADYCAARGLTDGDRTLIEDALRHLRLLR